MTTLIVRFEIHRVAWHPGTKQLMAIVRNFNYILLLNLLLACGIIIVSHCTQVHLL